MARGRGCCGLSREVVFGWGRRETHAVVDLVDFFL